MVIRDLVLEEKVTWDKLAYPDLVSAMIMQYGEGPFEIVGLRLHNSGARISRNSSVAPYAVTVKLLNGKRQEFAGEWFRRVSQFRTPGELTQKLVTSTK
jgi:hypothetical protein